MSILIAEDNRVNLRMLTFILSNLGHDVVPAVDGQEALEYLAEAPVDLIIADIDMPKVDGITLLKQLRSTSRYCNLPIIVLTASGEHDDHTTAWEAGANAVLTKPTSSQELSETVTKMLSLCKTVEQ